MLLRNEIIGSAIFLSMQLIMEIPLELMLTISQRLPWMFFPDIIPVGHPIFDIINSTNPEVSVAITFFRFDHLFTMLEMAIMWLHSIIVNINIST